MKRPSQKLVKVTRSPPRSTSRAGSRPHWSHSAGAEPIAASTTPGGMRTDRASLSTVHPASANTSRASASSTQTPVSSSTFSVASWRSSRSRSLSTPRRTWAPPVAAPVTHVVHPCSSQILAFVRNRSTQFTGMPSTSVMRNLASIALGWSG